MLKWTLFLIFITSVKADIYGSDTNEDEDQYDNAWMDESMQDYNKNQQKFKHKNLGKEKSTEKTEERKGNSKDIRMKNARIR